MDVQGISPVKTLVGAGSNRINALHPSESLHNAGEKSRPAVEQVGSAGEDSGANRIRPRVQPLHPAPSTIKPIDFHDGVIGTFINEMDLLQNRVMASGDQGSQQALDALV